MEKIEWDPEEEFTIHILVTLRGHGNSHAREAAQQRFEEKVKLLFPNATMRDVEYELTPTQPLYFPRVPSQGRNRLRRYLARGR